MDEKLASKQDLRDLKTDMDHRFSQIAAKIDLTESRLTIKMGTMLAASIAVLTAIQKLI